MGVQESLNCVRAKASHRAKAGTTLIMLGLLGMLSACSGGMLPDTAGLLAVSPSPADLAARANTDVGRKLDGQDPLIIANERLNVKLLQQFYARHNFKPVWTSRQAQADALTAAVLRAGDQGLNPDLFHAKLLRRQSTLSPTDRDLVLSDAYLSYADALARGVVPVERRGDDEVLTPERIDVAAKLDAAIASPHPAAAIEALAPTTPTYIALRKALAASRSGKTLPAARLRTIEVNLERQRWLPRSLPADRVWVNVADEQLVLYRDNQPVFKTRVVVGEDVKINQSPEFRATIDAAFYNPPWVIPRDIAAKEILPKAAANPNYLADNHMVALANGEVEQLPGPEAGLGYLMFDMPNNFDVYLHDTPNRDIFNLSNRRLSHGCIRVQNPRELAALLMRQSLETVNDGIAAGGTTRHNLPKPMPIFVVYETAFVDTQGVLQFRPDFYQRDAAIWSLMQKGPMEDQPRV